MSAAGRFVATPAPLHLQKLYESYWQPTFRALAGIVPPLRSIGLDGMTDLKVKGGVIVARGTTDIVDPRSELQYRCKIGSPRPAATIPLIRAS